MKIGMVIRHEIKITPTKNFGFVVKIGCGTFCAASWPDLIADLKIYLSDPKAWEKAYSGLEICEEPGRQEDIPPPISA